MTRLQRMIATTVAAALVPTLGFGKAILSQRFERGAYGAPQFGEFSEDGAAWGWRYEAGGDATGTITPRHGIPVTPAVRDLGEKGSLSFVAVRTPASEPYEAVVTLVNGETNRLFKVELWWDYSGQSGVLISKDDRCPDELWKSVGTLQDDFFAFPKPVSMGKPFRVTLTWGPDVNDNSVYLDGAPFRVKPGIVNLTRTLAGADALVIGAEPRAENMKLYGRVRSLVSKVVLGDTPSVDAMFLEPLTVATDRKVYAGGGEIVVTLRGGKDGAGKVTVDGVAKDAPMAEVDDGVYVVKVKVPAGLNVAAAAVNATLTNPASGNAESVSAAAVAVDSTGPEGVGRIVVTPAWVGEMELAWDPSASKDVAAYRVFRGDGAAPATVGAPLAEVKGTSFTDTRVIAGLEYQYAVVAVDAAGNTSAPSDVVAAKAVAGDGPKVASVQVTPEGRPLRPGALATVTVVGQSDAQVSVDLGTVAAGVKLEEQGRTGRYVGSYTVKDADLQATKSLQRVVVHVSDAFGATDLAGPEVPIVGLDVLNDKTPPVIARVTHNGSQAAGISGKLVAGDVVVVTAEGEAGGYGTVEMPGAVAATAMKETAPGVYTGSVTVPWGLYGGQPVLVRLADEAGNESTATAEKTLEVDARVRLTVASSKALLPADRKSQAQLVARAENANGKGVEGHELALTLSTTEEYTGVVGGGSVEDKQATKDDEDDVEVKWGGKTDGVGEVKATYTAGFAAKTALVVAKDLTTGDVGAGWLNTYVAATVAIQLTPRSAKGAEDRALLRMTAEPARLTADGRSTSRLKATLLDLAGAPISGAKVAFALAGENGRVRVIRGTTDARGVVEAEYRAGTAMGVVTVTASAAEYGVTAAVEIWLLADAPAKIDMVASAAKLVADGRSEAAVSVKVTDINDNPNGDTPVLFSLLSGSGKFSASSLNTDQFGRAKVTFTAGTTAGMAVLEARHTSRAPTGAELRRVYGTLFVPRLYDRQERDRTSVAEWKVKAGDEVAKGQVLAVLDTRTGTVALKAPAKGVFVREVRHEGDRVDLGDTVGYVEVDEQVWADEYGK